MPSDSKKSDVTYTKQMTPNEDEILNNAGNGISIDYVKETVTVNGDEYEVYVPADGKTEPEHGMAASVSGYKQSGSIMPAIDGDKKIYVRKKEVTKADGVKIPVSDWLALPANGRPETSASVPEILRDNVKAEKNCPGKDTEKKAHKEI